MLHCLMFNPIVGRYAALHKVLAAPAKLEPGLVRVHVCCLWSTLRIWLYLPSDKRVFDVSSLVWTRLVNTQVAARRNRKIWQNGACASGSGDAGREESEFKGSLVDKAPPNPGLYVVWRRTRACVRLRVCVCGRQRSAPCSQLFH